MFIQILLAIVKCHLLEVFFNFNCEDDILKKSANKNGETAKVIVKMKSSIVRFYYDFYQ